MARYSSYSKITPPTTGMNLVISAMRKVVLNAMAEGIPIAGVIESELLKQPTSMLVHLSRAGIPKVSKAAKNKYLEETNSVEVGGRAFFVEEAFSYDDYGDKEECVEEVNDYLGRYKDEAVILDDGEMVFIAHVDDEGIEL